jgi:hypothetical protein
LDPCSRDVLKHTHCTQACRHTCSAEHTCAGWACNRATVAFTCRSP